MIAQGGNAPIIDLVFQEQVDSFNINYPDHDTIRGNLWIQWAEDLDSLYKIKHIKGDLFFFGYRGSDLSGLSNLERIDKSLMMRGALVIKTLSGLDNLSWIGEDLIIEDSDNLETFHGLEKIERLRNLKITDSKLILSLQGLSRLKIIEEDLDIRLSGIVALDGVDFSEKIGGKLKLQSNHELFNTHGLTSKLKEIGEIDISFCNVLTGHLVLFGIEKCGAIKISTCRKYKGIAGFENVEIIDGDIRIHDTGFERVIGLNNLKRINGSLILEDNTALDDLGGFFNLEELNGNLEIVGCPALTDLEALSNLDSRSISSLTITDNEALDMCSYDPICTFLNNSPTEAVINNNAEGCASIQIVKESCPTNVASPDDLVKVRHLLNMKNLGEIMVVGVVNEAGQALSGIVMDNEMVDLRDPPNGTYVISIVTAKGTFIANYRKE